MAASPICPISMVQILVSLWKAALGSGDVKVIEQATEQLAAGSLAALLKLQKRSWAAWLKQEVGVDQTAAELQQQINAMSLDLAAAKASAASAAPVSPELAEQLESERKTVVQIRHQLKSLEQEKASLQDRLLKQSAETVAAVESGLKACVCEDADFREAYQCVMAHLPADLPLDARMSLHFLSSKLGV